MHWDFTVNAVVNQPDPVEEVTEGEEGENEKLAALNALPAKA